MATRYLVIPQPRVSSMVKGFARHPSMSTAPRQWDGLVGAWAPYLGIQGSVLHDVSGAGHNGNIINVTPATDWSTSVRVGEGVWGVTVNGTTSYVDFVDTTLFDFPDTTFTVSMWVKPVAIGLTRYLLNKRDTIVSTAGWFLRTDATGTITARIMGLASTVCAGRTSVVTLTAGVWSHVAVVLKTSTVDMANDVSIYMNGVLSQGSLTNDPETYLVSGVSVKIGVQADLLANTYFNGAIDDIRVYDRGLTAQEIWEMYLNSYAMLRLRERYWAIREEVGSLFSAAMGQLTHSGGMVGSVWR
jgi:hypothetical protein